MKVVTTEVMRQREELANYQGTSYLQLMENAGTGVAEDLQKSYVHAKSLLVLCGKGNNAGDGLVIARLLSEIYSEVAVILLLGNELSELTDINYQKLPESVKVFDQFDEEILNHYDIVVDAVFGIGFKGTLSDELRRVFRALNRARNVTVSLDVPSGINADTGEHSEDAVQADVTYIFDSYKVLHEMSGLSSYIGEMILVDIGITQEE